MFNSARSCNRVRTYPGQVAVTDTPESFSCVASDSVKTIIQALAAEYVPVGSQPATLATLIPAAVKELAG